MSIFSRKGLLYQLRFEIIVALVIALVIIGQRVHDRPLQLEAPDEIRSSAPPPASGEVADVLIALPTVSTAQSLEQMSFDQAWLNAVERELGRPNVVDVSGLTRSSLDGAHWLILPRRAAAQADPQQIEMLASWVTDGGLLIIEQPEGPWRDVLGQSFGGGLRPTRRITSFDGARTRGELRNDLMEAPFRTTIAPFNPPQMSRGRDFRVLMEADGLPAIVELQSGEGHILLLLFDFGRLATLTMQGTPDNSFLLPPPPHVEEAGPWTQARMGIADDALMESTIPWVDLLERNILYLAEERRPVGRFWYYPGTTRGALLVTHSEAGVAQRAEYLTDWEHGAGVESTLFVRPTGLGAEGLARISRKGSSVQHLWYPPGHPMAPVSHWSLGNFRPVERPMRLDEQLERLNDDLVPYGPLVASRSADGLWTTRWLDGFRILQSAGVVLDSSFGPLSDGVDPGWGYLFGTGRPYRPIDSNGHRFRLIELPYQLSDMSSRYTLARARRLIIDSSDRYHSTVVIDWRADTMMRRPSFDALEGWRMSFDLAHSQDLWTPQVAEFVEFHFRRLGSTVRSSFDMSERSLTLEVSLQAQENVDVERVVRTPSVAFPVRFEGRPAERVVHNGETIEIAELSLSADRVLHIHALHPGEHTIVIHYGTLPEHRSLLDDGDGDGD